MNKPIDNIQGKKKTLILSVLLNPSFLKLFNKKHYHHNRIIFNYEMFIKVILQLNIINKLKIIFPGLQVPLFLSIKINVNFMPLCLCN